MKFNVSSCMADQKDACRLLFVTHSKAKLYVYLPCESIQLTKTSRSLNFI
jgi:hypothetical protein